MEFNDYQKRIKLATSVLIALMLMIILIFETTKRVVLFTRGGNYSIIPLEQILSLVNQTQPITDVGCSCNCG